MGNLKKSSCPRIKPHTALKEFSSPHHDDDHELHHRSVFLVKRRIASITSNDRNWSLLGVLTVWIASNDRNDVTRKQHRTLRPFGWSFHPSFPLHRRHFINRLFTSEQDRVERSWEVCLYQALSILPFIPERRPSRRPLKKYVTTRNCDEDCGNITQLLRRIGAKKYILKLGGVKVSKFFEGCVRFDSGAWGFL